MSDNGCKWKSEHFDYKCEETDLDSEGLCILHSEKEDKNTEKFIDKVVERMSKGRLTQQGWEFNEIDFVGSYFPKGFGKYFQGRVFKKFANFKDATFSGDVRFTQAHFKESVSLWQARFLQNVHFCRTMFGKESHFSEVMFVNEACFKETVFSESVNFLKTNFNKVEFNGALFKGPANFDQANFKGNTNFTWSEFWGWTFFFKNSKKTCEYLERPLQTEIPNHLKDRISYGASKRFLICNGTMSPEEKEELLRISKDDSYKQSMEKLSQGSQVMTLGCPATFYNTRFLGEVIFQDVDLSQCSFRDSNIDKVDFRYCTFNEKRDRQNVLRDELNADDGKVGYEHVRRLYLELKCNFENKKDWNLAGDFHYGEMECGRRMYGWSIVEGILFNLYFWSSGYGERPLRAFVCLLVFVLLIFPLLYYGFERDPFGICIWNSVKVATFMRIGNPVEPDTVFGKFFLVLEFIIGPTLFLLFALAVRRKVKR